MLYVSPTAEISRLSTMINEIKRIMRFEAVVESNTADYAPTRASPKLGTPSEFFQHSMTRVWNAVDWTASMPEG